MEHYIFVNFIMLFDLKIFQIKYFDCVFIYLFITSYAQFPNLFLKILIVLILVPLVVFCCWFVNSMAIALMIPALVPT